MRIFLCAEETASGCGSCLITGAVLAGAGAFLPVLEGSGAGSGLITGPGSGNISSKPSSSINTEGFSVTGEGPLISGVCTGSSEAETVSAGASVRGAAGLRSAKTAGAACAPARKTSLPSISEKLQSLAFLPKITFNTASVRDWRISADAIKGVFKRKNSSRLTVAPGNVICTVCLFTCLEDHRTSFSVSNTKSVSFSCRTLSVRAKSNGRSTINFPSVSAIRLPMAFWNEESKKNSAGAMILPPFTNTGEESVCGLALMIISGSGAVRIP